MKYLSNFWRTLINGKINLILSWSANCVISSASANQNTTFVITDTKLYVLYEKCYKKMKKLYCVICDKNMADENISQEFRFKNIDETRKYLIEEINQN